MNRTASIALTAGIVVILLIIVGLAVAMYAPSLNFGQDTGAPTTPPQTTSTPTPNAIVSPTPNPTTNPTHTPTTNPTPTSTTPHPTTTPSPTTTPTPTATPTPTPIPSPSPHPTPNPATIVFSDNFQSGNTNAWTNTDISGVNLNVTDSGLKFSTTTPTNGHWGYVYKWLNKTYDSIDWRWHLFLDNLPTTDGNIIGAGGIYNSAIEGNFTPANGICALSVIRINGASHWNLAYVNGTSVYSINSTQTVSPNTWYLVELKGTQGAGNGEVHFYLNDIEILNATNLSNTHNPGIDHISVGGGITAEQPVTWYCASAIASTEYIETKESGIVTNPVIAGYITGTLTSMALVYVVITNPQILLKFKLPHK